MSDKPEYVYIMYPIPIDKIKDMDILLPAMPELSIPDEENFMPLWYGNARFPEDEA